MLNWKVFIPLCNNAGDTKFIKRIRHIYFIPRHFGFRIFFCAACWQRLTLVQLNLNLILYSDMMIGIYACHTKCCVISVFCRDFLILLSLEYVNIFFLIMIFMIPWTRIYTNLRIFHNVILFVQCYFLLRTNLTIQVKV